MCFGVYPVIGDQCGEQFADLDLTQRLPSLTHGDGGIGLPFGCADDRF